MRNLPTELESFLDKSLEHNGLAQQALDKKDARALFRLAAEACVGIREQGGNNRGKFVELFQKTVDGKAQAESWCMAFVQSMLAYAEKKTGEKSPLVASEHCQTVFLQTKLDQRVKFSPLPGAIVVWQHGASSNGHTGIVTGCDEKVFHAIEGNTESGMSNGHVERDGGGVYSTVRDRVRSGDMKVMGFLKPF
jgi:hypothetical protein